MKLRIFFHERKNTFCYGEAFNKTKTCVIFDKICMYFSDIALGLTFISKHTFESNYI